MIPLRRSAPDPPALDAENNVRRKEQLQNSYIGYLDPVSLVPCSKLELNRHNNRFYQTSLVPLVKLPQRGLNISGHQLRRAFNWFRERIRYRSGMTVASGRDLAEFLDRLVDKLFFTVITVIDELNAFKVLETLNARGVRLSSTDLLKNYCTAAHRGTRPGRSGYNETGRTDGVVPRKLESSL